MASSRIIKPDFFFDEELADVPIEARFLLISIWCQADRDGRLKDSARALRAVTFPYDLSVDVAHLLKTLNEKFIFQYEIDGCRYIQILNWAKHGKWHTNERSRGHPVPNIESLAISDIIKRKLGPSFGEASDKLLNKDKDKNKDKDRGGCKGGVIELQNSQHPPGSWRAHRQNQSDKMKQLISDIKERGANDDIN